MKLLTLVFSVLFSFTVSAGPIKIDTDGIEVGNGGFIVQCPVLTEDNYYLESSEFFDYYEYKKEHPNWRIDPSFLDKSYYTTALKILKNYERIDEFSAATLVSYSSVWFALEQTQTVLSLILTDNFYKTQVLVPAPTPYINSDLLKNCRTRQIISFAKNDSGSFEYRILPEYFSSLDTISKAVALIHEINYLDQIKSVDNSPLHPNVIRQTQFIFALPNLENASSEELLDWQTKNSLERQLNRLEFSQYGKYKVRLRKSASDMPQEILSNNEYIESYWNPLYKLNISANGKRIADAYIETSHLEDTKTGLSIEIGGRTHFYENGDIRESSLKVPFFFNNAFCFSTVKFRENGDLASCL